MLHLLWSFRNWYSGTSPKYHIPPKHNCTDFTQASSFQDAFCGHRESLGHSPTYTCSLALHWSINTPNIKVQQHFPFEKDQDTYPKIIPYPRGCSNVQIHALVSEQANTLYGSHLELNQNPQLSQTIVCQSVKNNWPVSSVFFSLCNSTRSRSEASRLLMYKASLCSSSSQHNVSCCRHYL